MRSSSARGRTAWSRRTGWPRPGSGSLVLEAAVHLGRGPPHRGAHPARIPARRVLDGPPARRRISGVPGVRSGVAKVWSSLTPASRSDTRSTSERALCSCGTWPKPRPASAATAPRGGESWAAWRTRGEPLVDALLSPLQIPPKCAAGAGPVRVDRCLAVTAGRARRVPRGPGARAAGRPVRSLHAVAELVDHRGIRDAPGWARPPGGLAGGGRRLAVDRGRTGHEVAVTRRRGRHRPPGDVAGRLCRRRPTSSSTSRRDRCWRSRGDVLPTVVPTAPRQVPVRAGRVQGRLGAGRSGAVG